jgi:hypothetical protein
VWRPVKGSGSVAPGLELSGESLAELLRQPAVAAPEAVPDEAELAAERRRYLDEARRIAADLAARRRAEAPRWNPPSGDAEVDGMVWFRYVHAEGL